MRPNTPKAVRRVALANWANFLFNMSISLAHEYVHVFVGMLSGAQFPRTPLIIHYDSDEMDTIPGMNTTGAEDNWILQPNWDQIPPGLEYKLSGESGYAWEGRVLGGKVVCYYLEALDLPGVGAEESSGAPSLV